MSNSHPTERSPLLNGNNSSSTSISNGHGVDSPKIELPPPTWLASFKFFIFGSWFNILLVFLPLSAVAHYLDWDAALRFSFSFIAIMPLAAVRRVSTCRALYLAELLDMDLMHQPQ